MWRDVTDVSTLRDDLTFIVSVSLRLFQPFFPLASIYQKIQEFMQIQDTSRMSKFL